MRQLIAFIAILFIMSTGVFLISWTLITQPMPDWLAWLTLLGGSLLCVTASALVLEVTRKR